MTQDMSARVYTREPTEGYVPVSLTGHRAQLVASYFSKQDDEIYTVSYPSISPRLHLHSELYFI